MQEESLQQRVDLVLDRLDRLPSPSMVAIRLFQATGSSETALSDVVSILRQDPGMATRVLAMCRRCHRGLAEEVDSLERAVVLLGFQEIRTATLAIEISGVLGRATTSETLDRMRRHSILVGSLCRLLADGSSGDGSIDPGAAYLAGLLHNLGHLALACAIPTPFSKLVDSASLSSGDLDDTLMRVIGLDGPRVGRRMALAWGLPRELERVVARRPAADDDGATGIDQVVACAEELLLQTGFASWRARPLKSMVDDRLERLGLSATDGDALLADAVDRAAEDAATLGLEEAPPSRLLIGTLARANAELERLVHRPEPERDVAHGDVLAMVSELPLERGLEPTIDAIGRSLAARHPDAAVRIAWRRDRAWFGRDGSGRVRPLGVTPRPFIDGPSRRIVGVEAGTLVISSEGGPVLGEIEHGALENVVRSVIAADDRSVAMDRRRARGRGSDRRIEEAIDGAAEVTAGAVHEINNPLSVVVGRSRILKGWVGDVAVANAASEIHEAARRIDGIVAGLHGHATASRIEPTSMSTEVLLRRCAEAAQTRLEGLGPVEIDDRSGPLAVEVDVRRIVDLVVEACRNALETKEDVRIRLRGSSDALNSRWNLQVEDDGPGFGRRALEHAFEPFFSLKPAGRKAGMGLTVARRVMEAHGGTAAVGNHDRGGGSVVFGFPSGDERAASGTAA